MKWNLGILYLENELNVSNVSNQLYANQIEQLIYQIICSRATLIMHSHVDIN